MMIFFESIYLKLIHDNGPFEISTGMVGGGGGGEEVGRWWESGAALPPPPH